MFSLSGCEVREGRRKVERPRLRWLEEVQNDSGELEVKR
jgi:hypothetical protein